MSKEKPKFDFEEIWEERLQFEDDIKGFTEDLIKDLKKEGVSDPILAGIVRVFAEIDALMDWIVDEKLSSEKFETWHKNKYLKHTHLDGEILVPETEV